MIKVKPVFKYATGDSIFSHNRAITNNHFICDGILFIVTFINKIVKS